MQKTGKKDSFSQKHAGLPYAVRNNKQESPGRKEIMKAILIGVSLAVIITIGGLLAGAWMLDQQWLEGDSRQYVRMIWLITAAAVGCASFYAAIRSGHAALWAALLTVGLYIVLRSGFSFLYGDGTVLDASGIYLAILQIGVAVLCAMAGRRFNRHRL